MTPPVSFVGLVTRMCLNLRKLRLATGLTVEIPCHMCWQCRADRVRNWVGKCLAESKTSTSVDFVTLTYADEGSPAAKWIKEPVEAGYAKSLHYEDVQKYFKRVRKAGYEFRYVIAGEYGSQKGRAHWHILMFWQGERPVRRKEKETGKPFYGNEWQDRFWHHGHVNYKPFSEKGARYVCKYLLKWDSIKEPDRVTKFNYSARPGIGFKWICENWSQMHVEQGLSPQSAKYRFRDVMRAGVAVNFMMTPHCQIKFVQDFEQRWKKQRGGHPPPSDFCEKVLSRVARRLVSDALERRKYVPKPEWPPPNGERIQFDDKLNAYYFDCGGFRALRFYWSFDEKGVRSWERDLVSPSKASSCRAEWASGASDAYRAASQAPSSSGASSGRRKGFPPGRLLPVF